MPEPPNSPIGTRFVVTGSVQGVGFRPFVARACARLDLKGTVQNTGTGLQIDVFGVPRSIDVLRARLHDTDQHPGTVERIREANVEYDPPAGFSIASSAIGGPNTAPVPNDKAICDECLNELRDPGNRRFRYPFISCAACGPRYTIIESLPFDRRRTAMRDWPLCGDCHAEYEDPDSRRYHAQTICCPQCGPHIRITNARACVSGVGEDALQLAVRLLRRGQIVAVQGAGGFRLIADATSGDAVRRLRTRKRRRRRPFAVVASDESVGGFVTFSAAERTAWSSPSAPIVVAHRGRDVSIPIHSSVSPNVDTIGVMRVPDGLIARIVDEMRAPLVATSGNVSGEPIASSSAEAFDSLRHVADAFLVHDRRIVRPIDDSVVRQIGGVITVLRAGRGIAPVRVPFPSLDRSAIALGGHLKSTIARADAATAEIRLYPHIGDLDTAEARTRYRRTLRDARDDAPDTPTIAVHDDHPDYATTIEAERFEDMELRAAQHHRAHAAACLLENRCWPTPEPILCVVFDGAGYGSDHTQWGGELFVADGIALQRVARLRPFPLLGGDRMAVDPVRSAVALASQLSVQPAPPGQRDDPTISAGRPHGTAHWPSELSHIPATLWRIARSDLTPRTSSCGRLFDAVAALLGICTTSTFEGEAAMRLESFARSSRAAPRGTFTIDASQVLLEIDWRPFIEELLTDRDPGFARGLHDALASAVIQVADRVRTRRIALSGGCFQNALLVDSIHRLVQPDPGTHPGKSRRTASTRVLMHRYVPPNDGGLAVGQLAIAMAGGSP